MSRSLYDGFIDDSKPGWVPARDSSTRNGFGPSIRKKKESVETVGFRKVTVYKIIDNPNNVAENKRNMVASSEMPSFSTSTRKSLNRKQVPI